MSSAIRTIRGHHRRQKQRKKSIMIFFMYFFKRQHEHTSYITFITTTIYISLVVFGNLNFLAKQHDLFLLLPSGAFVITKDIRD